MASTIRVEAPPHAVADDSARTRRLIGGVVAICATGILGLAAWFEPSSAGLGTHSQLNMPACGWITLADLPCPTCGMTTSFAHAAEGNLAAAFIAQPMGALLAIAVAITWVVAVYTALTGSRVAVLFKRLWVRHTGWALAAGLGVAWAYKILSYKGLL